MTPADIIRPMAEVKKPPAPRSFRPSRAKIAVVLLTLALLLATCTTLFILGYRYKRKYGEMLRRESARANAAMLLEYARDNLARADRLSRRADSDPADIKGLCENGLAAASKAAALRPDLDEPYFVRGRALEMQFRFEEADADYTEALRKNLRSFARYHRGFLDLRRHLRASLVGPSPEGPVNRAREDLRLYIHHSQGDIKDDRNEFVALLGVAYFSGNYASIPRLADNASRFDPTEWLVPFVRGAALLRLEKLEPALEAFDEAARLLPYAAEAHAFRGLVLRRQGKLPEAIEALNVALRQDEQFPEAVHLRGLSALDARRFDDARRDFLFCAKLRPSFLDARIQAASAGLEWWLRTGRKDAELLRSLAQELDAVVLDDPSSTDARVARARVLLESGNVDAALRDADAALTKTPGRKDALDIRARIHMARRDWAAADRDYTELGNLRERAHVRMLAGRYDEAVADVDLLLLKDPKDVSLHLQRARILLAAGRPDEALATLDRSQANVPRAKLLRAEAMLAKKDAPTAIRLATEAFASDSQLAEALVVRGKAHLFLGNKEAAAEDFRKALEIDPGLKDRLP